MIFYYIDIRLSNKGTDTGNASIEGFPFDVIDNLPGTSIEARARAINYTNIVDLTHQFLSDGTNSFTAANSSTLLDDTDFSNTTSFVISGFLITS